LYCGAGYALLTGSDGVVGVHDLEAQGEEILELSPIQQQIWERVRHDLAEEPVASPDHSMRVAGWAARIGKDAGADVRGLVTAALLHDIGAVIDRERHYLEGRQRAEEILAEVGYPEDRRSAALHILESHSRYGGPPPLTTEAKIGKDADALEWSGAIGLVRSIVRGVAEGNFSGHLEDLLAYLEGEIGKVEGTFHTEQAEALGQGRIAYMRSFLERIRQELEFEA